ncbi:hypothetical protein FEO91_08730 [Stenotrophomonas maltophilia]|nr:hypothetical protein FEO91_08730 [Stenotrophomonas maltophilia]
MGTFTVSGDFGSLADWAAVAVGGCALLVAVASALIALAGAAAVAFLAWQANRQVKRIDERDGRVRQREADLLMLMLEAQIGMLGVSLRSLVSYLQDAGRAYESDAAVRAAAADRVASLSIAEVDENFHRLHVLPNEVGYSLARLKGALGALRTTVEAGRHARDPDTKGVHSAMEQITQKLLVEVDKVVQAIKSRRKQLFSEIA